MYDIIFKNKNITIDNIKKNFKLKKLNISDFYNILNYKLNIYLTNNFLIHIFFSDFNNYYCIVLKK